jgi:hypothetical protein
MKKGGLKERIKYRTFDKSVPNDLKDAVKQFG